MAEAVSEDGPEPRTDVVSPVESSDGGDAVPVDSASGDTMGFSAFVPASPWSRIGAFLLEYVLYVVTLGIGYLIWWLVVAGQGQTPGKAVLALQCITEDGEPARGLRMFGRELTRGLLILPAPGLLIGLVGSISEPLLDIVGPPIMLAVPVATLVTMFRGSGRTLWDHAASTMVIDV